MTTFSANALEGRVALVTGTEASALPFLKPS